MTDTTPRATVCPEEGCHALIPATIEDRSEHRRGHANDRKVVEAIRARQKDLENLVSRLRVEVAEFSKELDNIEIPEPVQPLEIEAWPEDEIDPPADVDTDDEGEDEEYDFPLPATPNVNPSSLYTPATATDPFGFTQDIP